MQHLPRPGGPCIYLYIYIYVYCAQVNLFLSDLTGRFLLFHNPFLDPFYHGGVDPMLNQGTDFEFDSDGKKVVKATGV